MENLLLAVADALTLWVQSGTDDPAHAADKTEDLRRRDTDNDETECEEIGDLQSTPGQDN